MSNVYEHPFELQLIVGIDPKPGYEVVERGDHVLLERGNERVHYDPRDVVQRLNDLLRELTSRDDGVAWQVRNVKIQESGRDA